MKRSALSLIIALILFAPFASQLGAQETIDFSDPCATPRVRPAGDRGINVRTGPDRAFGIVAVLDLDESMVIVGRAEFQTWWQVALPNGGVGWVLDNVVLTSGNVGDVPLVPPPGLPDGTPLPRIAWSVPETPDCALTPTATPVPPTRTPRPTRTPTPEPVVTLAPGWAAPVNLSQSGAASDPQLVVDVAGIAHALWVEDALGTFFYVRDLGDGWETPTAVNLPFADSDQANTNAYIPRLVATNDGRIHAFWIDEDDILFTSNVAAGNFGDGASWTPAEALADNVAGLTAVADAAAIHLAFLSGGNDAGVYYRRRGQATWSTAVALSRSAYLRAVRQDEVNLSLAADGRRVVLGWDNRPLERVYFALSTDNGASWGPEQEIDRRLDGDGSAAVGPTDLTVAIVDDALHLSWRAGHDGAVCRQWHQWTDDDGQSWSAREPILADFNACPTAVTFHATDGAALLLAATVNDSPYLQAWDGEAWSAAQLQSALGRMLNPVTLREFSLRCRQYVPAQERLYVIGCDEAGADIWVTVRPLADVGAWFPLQAEWIPPATLADTPSGTYLSPLLVGDAAGRIHAFWSVAEATAGETALPSEIFYAVREGGSWSRPAPVLRSPGGKAESPSVAVDGRSRLVAVWSGGSEGQIYFSWADAGRASVSAEWSAPEPLPMPRENGAAPHITVDRAGTIFVTYALPFNEGRGIYQVRSVDGGETWSEPLLLFDAEASGWPGVSSPRLLVLENAWHLNWQLQPLPGSARGAALYYARSGDGGVTWAAPRAVESRPNSAGSVIDFALAGSGGRIAHQTWQEVENGRLSLWHQVSLDNGLNWSRPVLLSGPADLGGPAALAVDAVGRTHLLQLANVVDGEAVDGRVRHWQWLGERWEEQESVAVRGIGPATDAALAAAAPGFRLGLLLVTAGSGGQSQLRYADRALVAPEVAPTPLPTLTPTATPTARPTGTPLPQPTATPAFPTASDSDSLALGLGLPATIEGLAVGGILALLPALFIVGIAVFGYVRLRARRR